MNHEELEAIAEKLEESNAALRHLIERLLHADEVPKGNTQSRG